MVRGGRVGGRVEWLASAGGAGKFQGIAGERVYGARCGTARRVIYSRGTWLRLISLSRPPKRMIWVPYRTIEWPRRPCGPSA